MARAALNWSTRDLAKAAGVSSNTVSRFESGKPAIPATLKTIRQAFEAEGLIFIAEGEESLRGGPGVRFTEDGGVVPPKKGAAEEKTESSEV
jgi:transcriptional regulator with XRE-family HTH domain